MSWEWLNLKNWKYFPNEIQERCRSIGSSVGKKIRSLGTLKKYKGSYSFKFLLNSGNTKTIAKLIPHDSYSGPVILAGFSKTEHGARDYASKFDTRVHEFTVMHEPFFVSKVPEDWPPDRVADVFAEFMRRAETRKLSVEDMQLLEAIEDKIDIAEAQKAIRRNKFTSWKQAKKKLGL